MGGAAAGPPDRDGKPVAAGQAGLCWGQMGRHRCPTTGRGSESRVLEELRGEKGMWGAPLLGPGGWRRRDSKMAPWRL